MESRGRWRAAAGRVTRAGLALAALAGLAGCKLDVTADVTMAADGTGAVTITAVADGELLAKAPGALSDLRLDDARTAGWGVEGPAADGVGGQKLVLSKPFSGVAQANAVLAEIAGPNGPLHDLKLTYERTFGRTRSKLTGTAELVGGVSAFGDDALTAALGGRPALSNVVAGDVADGLALTVTANLPGRTGGNSGSAGNGGRTVTWVTDLHEGKVTELSAPFTLSDEGALTARSASRLARVVAVVWALAALVALGGVVTLASARGRRRARGARRR